MATLEELFSAFGRGKDLDSRTFVKLCKDCKLLGGGLTQTDCDLIFTKCKAKGAARLTFSEFEAAMEAVAAKKKLPLAALLQQVGPGGGPQFQGTAAAAVRFYDDKSTFTGVHAHGGPSTVDKRGKGTFSDPDPNQPSGAPKITLADICDRSTPDVRGVNKNFK
ncbi:p25-alpha domain-containing protein, putative [Eimeria necatrix]|uniref:p25-alpha domain-containing protein, putative n=1 Tax=Eimeria necatrix TaxID=51315 RepID=U6N2Z8_9EIME|nr:p25-alpha domain-containing protein, putative [Eimeria necatrix]CDJ70572.1 p25-alpha domain-containing protein, putative [Eimeria necatrix]